MTRRDMSELEPIDPLMRFADSNGIIRWQPVQNCLDAYDEYASVLQESPDNPAAQIMLRKLDPATVRMCQAARERARQCAEQRRWGDGGQGDVRAVTDRSLP